MGPQQGGKRANFKLSAYFPEQWLFYFIAVMSALIALVIYGLSLEAHIYNTHHKNPTSISFFGFLTKQNTPESSIETLMKNPDAFESALAIIAPILALLVLSSLLFGIHLIRIAKRRAQSLDEMNQKLLTQMAERVAMEETQQNLEKALLQGQKLQAIGTLAGGIAHDFNNILYAIIGFTEMAQEDVEKDSLVYDNLGKVLAASHRGQELVSRILTFSRRQRRDNKKMPIKSAIENALSLLIPTLPASILFENHIDIDEAFQIYGNQTEIHQVMVNIITNAVDAMEDEGLIQIDVRQIESHDPLFDAHPDIKAASYCKIDIRDTGFGMDEATMERIFEPFFTTKEVGKGTGLGLATVHAIVEDHHGKILVQSVLGQGTCFTILLPEYIPNTETITGVSHHGQDSARRR